MYSLKKNSILFFLAVLLFAACRKDEETVGIIPPTGTSTPPVPEVFVNGSFSGVVVDEANQFVEGVLISFDDKMSTTDENGFFSFRDVDINSKGSLVTAEKSGYFYNAKFVRSELNTHNFTEIKLIQKTLTGSFSSSAGGIVATAEGATVEFRTNTIQLENGGAYDGTVDVYATWLDPTAADLPQRMPGDLRAINSVNERRQLTTYGMIGVELVGSGGEALNIAEGRTATLEIPVPSELIGNAPTSIPLWHFDEETGYWMEEGEAVLEGDKYVGTVGHFSYWNLDVPSEAINISGLIKNEGNLPLNSVTVLVTQVSSGLSGFAFPDENGFFNLDVPINEELIISILDDCGDEIYSETIGPFSEDTALPIIFIATDGDYIAVTGNLFGCGSEPVTNGYLKLDFGGDNVAFLPTDENGNVNGLVSLCDATSVDVTAFDLDSLRTSTTTTEDIAGLDSLNFPSIIVCDDLLEYMVYSVAGVEVTDPTASANFFPPNTVGLVGFNPDAIPPTINIILDVDAPGIYTPTSVVATYIDPASGQNLQVGCGVGSAGSCDGKISVDITTYEGVDGYIIGSFSGTLDWINQVGDSQEVTGNFKIIVKEP